MRCLQDIAFLLKLYATRLVLHASVNSKPFHINYNNTNLRLKPDDTIIPPLAVIAVTVDSQGETLLLTLFSFYGESGATVSDWRH